MTGEPQQYENARNDYHARLVEAFGVGKVLIRQSAYGVFQFWLDDEPVPVEFAIEELADPDVVISKIKEYRERMAA